MVQAVILQIDSHARRLSLGIKQLEPDAWETFFANHMVNDLVTGKVVRAAQFGVFVEVAPASKRSATIRKFPRAKANKSAAARYSN